MFGLTVVKKAELERLQMHERMSRDYMETIRPLKPFLDEVRRVIREHHEYLDGINQGVVSIRFLAGFSPFKKHGKKYPVKGE